MRRILPLLCLVILNACAHEKLAEQQPLSDQRSYLIANGMVIDGTGSPARRADVLIVGDRIVKIGQNIKAPDAEVIDASGKVVTPGYIDTHAHGGPSNNLMNFLAQGVTTICLGQDGSSTKVSEMEEWMIEGDAAQPAVNIAPFVGHGTVRNEAGVGLSKNPTPEQIEAMAKLVDQAMELGCFGMTTGLEYQPGMFATREELAAVGKPVAKHGGIIMSHMRNEDDPTIKDTLQELLDQGKASGAPVHVSHMKVVYGHGAKRAEELLALIDAARASGQKVTADVYPYTASHTSLSILFPEWALPPNDYSEVVRTKHKELADFLRNKVNLRNGPEATLLSSGANTGKTLKQLADEKNKPFEEVMIDLGPRGGSAAYFVMDDELQSRLIEAPYVNISSDGSPSMHHPRGYGSAAKILNVYVRERKALTLEEAVRKMSGLPAETIGLTEQKRGLLKEGWAADVVVFDPETVRDTATFDEPHQLATGYDCVFVNGVMTKLDGRKEAAPGGRVLRKGRN